MRKLTVDEIIQGLVDAYERLLKLEAKGSGVHEYSIEYNFVKGEVKALRWVLGQSEYNIITEENENDNV